MYNGSITKKDPFKQIRWSISPFFSLIVMKSILLFNFLLSVSWASPASYSKKQFKVSLEKPEIRQSASPYHSRLVSFLVKQDQFSYNHGSGKLQYSIGLHVL